MPFRNGCCIQSLFPSPQRRSWRRRRCLRYATSPATPTRDCLHDEQALRRHSHLGHSPGQSTPGVTWTARSRQNRCHATRPTNGFETLRWAGRLQLPSRKRLDVAVLRTSYSPSPGAMQARGICVSSLVSPKESRPPSVLASSSTYSYRPLNPPVADCPGNLAASEKARMQNAPLSPSVLPESHVAPASLAARLILA